MLKSDFRLCDIYAARLAALRPLPKETLRSLRDYYRVGLTYTSNALEGNSLTESETMAEQEGELHPVEFAALVHQKFVYIHPFVDGNGRVARLLMNLAFMRAGWTIAIIPPICRAEYIGALGRAGQSPRDFILFVQDRVVETQRELLRLMGQSISVETEGASSPATANDRVNAGKNDRVNDRVNDGIAKEVLTAIAVQPGIRTNGIATYIGKSIPTISRYVKVLKGAGKIEFRGAPKNGGYYVICEV